MKKCTVSSAPSTEPAVSVAGPRLEVRVARGYGPGPCLVDVYRLVGAAYGCQVVALSLDEPGQEARLRLTPGSLAYHAPGSSQPIEVPPTTLIRARAQLGWPPRVPAPALRQQLALAHAQQPALASAGWAVLEDDAVDVHQAWPTLDAPARVTLMMLAAAMGADLVVQLMLQTWPHAAHQREPAPSGNTMLHYTALGGHAGCTLNLLESGACATQKNELDAEPKHEAARNAHAPVLRELLQASTIEGQDKFGDTPLIRLALYGPSQQPAQSLEAYQAIFAARNLEPRSTHWYSYVNRENRTGLSALDLAKLTGQQALVRALEADGACHSALFRMAPAYSLTHRLIYHGAQSRRFFEARESKEHGRPNYGV